MAYLLATGLWPLARLFVEALGAGDTGRPLGLMRETVESGAFRRAAWNTLWASAASVVVSAAIGTPIALATGLVRLPGRAVLSFLALSPLLIPSQIMALAWIELLGTASPVLGPLGLAPPPGSRNPLYSGAGVAWLLGIENVPLVFLAVRASLVAIPADLIEAARIAGAGPGRIALRVIAPLAMPAALAGSVLCFASAVGNFGVPALLGIPGRFPVLTTLIYQRLNGFGPGVIGTVAVMAVALVAMAGVALALRWVIARRLAVPMPPGAPFAGFEPGRWRWAILAALGFAMLWLSALPMLALLGTALVPALGVELSAETATLANFERALANPAVRRAFANSLVLSGAAALVSAAVALWLAWLAVVARDRVARALDLLADAPYVVPGTVLALAMILAYLPALPLIGASIYGTVWILLVAYLGRFLPMALRPVGAAMAAMDPSLDEAARIHGAGPMRRVLLVAAPTVLPSAAAGALLIALTALNELTLSALLWSAGHETVGVMVFSLQYEGNSTGAAALSVMSVGLVLALVLATDRLGRGLPRGALPWRQ